jgi:hypothetical protein
MRKFTLFLFAVLFCSMAFGQQNFFTDAGENNTFQTTGLRVIIPQKYRAATLDVQSIKNFLWTLPSEKNVTNRNLAPVLSLPMPDGKFARFHVWESSIQEPELQAKFPDIRTFAGQGIDDPYATIRFDYNPYFGFSAQILSAASGRIFIDPYSRKDINNYISYFAKDFTGRVAFNCSFDDVSQILPKTLAGPCLGTQLRTYRLAFSCTGEFAQAVGGGLAGPTHAAIVLGINRVTQVYEVELAIRLQLIGNNNMIEYLDPVTDPWLNNGSIAELNSITGIINGVIGVGNYDIGHLGCTASNAGVAFLGVVCGGNKGGGLTGGLNPVGDPYYIDYVAHEMGHQFGAGHSFNSNQCASAGGSYEPGSGTTIMAYAGICASLENIQPFSDPIFHAISFDQIGNFVTSGGGSTCPGLTSTGNTLPVITSLGTNNVSIPINTPFVLTGSATDADNDPITYNWEGWDIGPAGSWPSAATSTTRPLFRTRLSKTTGSRTFPDIRVIAANYPGTAAPSQMDGLRGEVLPLVPRVMKFRLTIRDNRAGGGGVVSSGEGCQDATTFQVNTVGSTPFAVTVPNGSESYAGGSTQTITWNNAGTTAPPFNVPNVKISLSTDGGLTYPTVITASTPNDGSEALTIPVGATTTARIKIEAVGNIFFDISNANFTITVPAAGYTLSAPAPAPVTCPAPASIQATLTASFFGGFSNPITLSATGNPGGTTVVFGTNPLTPATPSTTVTLTGTNTLSNGAYTITVSGVASGAPNQTQNITYTISPGAGPTINTHPVSQAVCQGGTVTFTVAATGATGYQWQKSTDGGVNWSPVPGATGTSYTIVNVQLSDAAQYRCATIGQCNSTNSNAAILTLNTAPAITAQPQDVTLCAGSSNTFSVTATGTNLTYQWQSAPGCAGSWNNIPAANSSTLNVTATITTSYRCIVSGTCTPQATSNCATLTVVTSVTVTTQPSNATVCEGSSTSFTVAGSGTGILYQWQLSTDGGANYNNIPGATAATYNITGVTFAMNNNRYRCLLSNPACTTPAISNAAILTVNRLPAISASPSDATVCAGGSNTFTVSATGTGITYQWYVSTDGGANYNPIGGATASTYTVSGATIGMNNNRYRCIVSGTCAPAAISGGAILSVIAPVSITAQPAASVICSGSNTSFAVAGTSTQTIFYQWQVSIDGGANWNPVSNGGVYSGATTATLSITAATTTINSYQYRCLLSNTTCTVPSVSGVALLSVRQLPTVTLTASLASLLPGKLSTLTAVPSATTGGVLSTAWLYNGVAPVPTITGNTYVADVEHVGTYQVLIQETFSSPALVCSNQSAIVTLTATPSDNLFIFPSPNDGRFTVSYYNNGGTSTKRTIAIFDTKGSNVFYRLFDIVGAYTLIPIDLRTNNTGIFYVVVGDANGKKLATGKVHVR